MRRMNMDSSLYISVIIPTYKPGGYIFDCLSSLVRQTLPNNFFEVILVLNGCKEPFEASLLGFIREKMSDMNVHFIQTDQGGVSNARNLALGLARGKYVCFLDDDDLLSENFLKNSLEEADEQSLVVSDVKYFFSNPNELCKEHSISKIYHQFREKNCGSLFSMRSFFSNACYKIIPRSIIGSAQFNPNFKMGEDSLFMFSISNKVKYVRFAEAIYFRRIREGSATQIKRRFKFKLLNALKLCRSYVSIYIKHPLQYNFFIFLSRIIATLMTLIK